MNKPRIVTLPLIVAAWLAAMTIARAAECVVRENSAWVPARMALSSVSTAEPPVLGEIIALLRACHALAATLVLALQDLRGVVASIFYQLRVSAHVVSHQEVNCSA